VLMIRLSRRGARKQPYYRIVVIEKDRARDGRSVEVVGTYNPRTSPASVEVKRERIDYWTGQGAQLSDRVKKLVDKAAAVAAASPPAEVVIAATAPGAIEAAIATTATAWDAAEAAIGTAAPVEAEASIETAAAAPDEDSASEVA
jgi:small subunit ribosomal protein S16